MKRIVGLVAAAIVSVLTIVYFFAPSVILQTMFWLERGAANLTVHSVQVDSHKVVYYDNQIVGGEVMVLLHGFAANKDHWTRFAKSFRQYRVIIPDLPGFGESSQIPKENYRIRKQIKRVEVFLNRLKIKKAHFAGNSMGGLLAAAIGLTLPERVLSLGLFAPAGAASAQQSELQKYMTKTGHNPFDIKTLAEYRNVMYYGFYDPPWVPDAVLKYFFRRSMKQRPFHNYVLAQLKSDVPKSFEPFMPKIKAPTLIVWGDTDRILHVSGAAIFHEGIGRSKMIVMDNCGHAPMLERPDEAAGHYQKFLNGL